MDERLAGALARATTEKARDEIPRVQLLPATVRDVSDSDPFLGTQATVHIVGDPPEVTHQVPVLVPFPMAPGTMVMVLYDPPEGAYVISTVGQGAIHSCGVMMCGGGGG